MTDTVTIRRELLERLADKNAFLHHTRKAQDELRAAIDSAPCDPRCAETCVRASMCATCMNALAAPVQEPMSMLDLREAAVAASPWAEQAERTGAFVKGAIWHAMTYAAPVQGEAVAWYTEDQLDDKSATTWSKEVAERWKAKGWPVSPLYTTPPQPAEVGELVEALRKIDRHNDNPARFDAEIDEIIRAALATAGACDD